MPTDFIYTVVRNDDVAALTRGMVIRISDDSAAVRAQADVLANLAGLYGVVGSGVVNVGGQAVTAISNAAAELVLLETGLTPVAGETLYVSATVPGRATNVAPGNVAAIGTIVDARDYARTSMVKAAIGAALE